MLTDNQITSLAREYAEEMIKGKPTEELPNCLKNSMLAMNTEHVAEIFQWLLRRYCLVEKSKVEEEYKSAKHDSKMAHREKLYTMLAVASARKALLESLFPEIGKEVEG
jgi:hypothetical protein